MIRFVVALTASRTIETRVNGEIAEFTQPAGTILRGGFCSDGMFNRQALAGDEIAVEVAAEDWPVNDVTHHVDLSGEEPVIAPKPT